MAMMSHESGGFSNEQPKTPSKAKAHHACILFGLSLRLYLAPHYRDYPATELLSTVIDLLHPAEIDLALSCWRSLTLVSFLRISYLVR
jgi:hypothetical protein